MSRMGSRTARLREIERLLYLKPEGLRAIELARQLQVSRRTVYRDLDFLSEQGVPLWQKDGRYGINRTRYINTVRLSFHESVALVLAGLLLSRTLDEHNPHVVSALQKLAVTLPSPLTGHLERAAARIRAHGAGRRQMAVLEAIASAWGDGYKVKLGYRSPRSGNLRERVLAPYALEPTQSGIYVIGYDEWAEDLRTFKLDRLEYASMLRQPFTIPDDFDLEAYLGSGWRIMAGEETQEVVLRFTPSAAPHVRERRWHPSQRLETLHNGGCRLRVQVADPREMQPWIRGWGAQVEVLEPAWLREQVAEEIQQAASQYSKQEAGSNG